MQPNQPQIPAWMKKWLDWPRWAQAASLLGLMVVLTAGWLLAGGSDSTPTSDAMNDPILLVGSVFLKLIVVVLLIIAAAWILRRVQSGSWKSTPRQMKVIETTHLSPRRAIHLIQVGNRRLLIGATDQSLNLLAELDESLPTETIPDEAFPEFLSLATQSSDPRGQL